MPFLILFDCCTGNVVFCFVFIYDELEVSVDSSVVDNFGGWQ